MKIYKVDTKSAEYREALDSAPEKYKAREKYLKEVGIKLGKEMTAREYLGDVDRNKFFGGYWYIVVGEPTTICERLAAARLNSHSGDDLRYLNTKKHFAEDLREGRTSWDEMHDYASGLANFIEEIEGMFASGKLVETDEPNTPIVPEDEIKRKAWDNFGNWCPCDDEEWIDGFVVGYKECLEDLKKGH